MHRRDFLAALAASTGLPLAQAADPFPTRPVRVILPFAAGGGPDVQMRQLGPKFGEFLGQSIVIENKVGAGGVLGAQFTAQAPADGYTLLYGANTMLVQKILQPEVKMDLMADFSAVSLMGTSPTVLVVSGESPHKTLADLLRAAKASPGKMNYSSGGIGTAAHLASATVAVLGGFQATHVPLKGSVEIPASLMRNDTQFACPIAGTAVPQVKSGRLRAIAVTGRTRLKELPQVPTLLELMKNELTVQEAWFGLFAPNGTPPDVVVKIHAAAVKAMQDPGVAAALEAGGTTVATSASPAQFAAFIRMENRKWADIVKLTKATAG